MSKNVFVGVISGTSVDGIDLALLEISGEITGQTTTSINILATFTAPLSSELRATLLALGQPGQDNIDDLGSADAALGEAIGHAVNVLLEDQGIENAQVAAIGCHGQTVRHRPEGASPFTLQIGDPNRIVEITRITTIADFRRRDMAAGGEAAPLVPPFHNALFRNASETRVVLNIGGIANVTVLSHDSSENVRGFDTGPGGALLDAWIYHHKQTPYDAFGAWGASGKVHRALLDDLLKDPYLSKPPPKSTGREHYNLAWLEPYLKGHDVAVVDTQATLTEFTAQTITTALATWASSCQRILVCGGGRHNTHLLERLRSLTPHPVETTDEHGIDGDGLEAGAFAWLAHQTLNALPGNDPSVTGARGFRILGGIYQP
ncbi:MAG: anhydro-N-acetylmuramic acid kinase [Gammaproteobacteria bacterium]|nr:anhydro-N-acetylmuramic acid kinase [Gammaproteobacteria bacterium]